MRIPRKTIFLDHVVILVGGLGTRLGNLTKKIPKPLLKINNEVFLDILIKNFSRFGFSKITLLTSYKSKFFFKKYEKKNIGITKINCIDEGDPKGTGGALINAQSKFSDFFLLSNGDTYFDINFHDFFFQSNKKKSLNFAITNQGVKNRFSFIKTKKNKILGFDKKKSFFANSGCYIVNKKLFFKNFLHYKKNSKASLEIDFLPKLVEENKCSFVKFKKSFLDIGIKSDLKKASNFINKNNAKKFAILDRDGVINYDYGYVSRLKDFKLKPGVVDAIKFLNNNNYYIFVVSNQSGIGRSYYTEDDVFRLHRYLNQFLKSKGAFIDEFFIAPYFKNSKFKRYRIGKYLRKPNIGLFKKIKGKYNIKVNGSFMIGNQNSDYAFAKKCKIHYFDVNKFKNIHKLVLKKNLFL